MSLDTVQLLRNALVAMLGIAGLACGWLLVLTGWRRVFPEHTRPDDDVLASRLGCGSCSCSTPCEQRRAEAPDPHHTDSLAH